MGRGRLAFLIDRWLSQNGKMLYISKEIEITIQEVEGETAYLLKTEANRRHLLRGIEEIQNGIPLQTMTLEQLNKLD